MRNAAAALSLALLAAGCAASGSDTAKAPPSPVGSSSASPSGGTTPPVPTARGSGRTVTVDGIVERGVEPGCLVLRAGARTYLLLQGANPVSATGVPLTVPVRVTGEVLTGVASYCQQGTPLRVRTVTRR